jgi:hypothetical protein
MIASCQDGSERDREEPSIADPGAGSSDDLLCHGVGSSIFGWASSYPFGSWKVRTAAPEGP